MEEIACPGAMVKIAHVKPAGTLAGGAWERYSLSVEAPKVGAAVSFSCVYLPCNLLERPQALGVEALRQQLYAQTTHHALQAQSGVGELAGLPEDPLQMVDALATVEFGGDDSGLLMLSSGGSGPLLLPPEGWAGRETSDDDEDTAPHDGSSEVQSGEPAPSPAAELLMAEVLAASRQAGCRSNAAQQDQEIYLMWAESLEGVRVSPSLLLASALLLVRREAAMFLRMATGFGFAQVGDYTASLFYLFRRRGHRLKCWECGVKKKAPCGKTARDDLPWCCHRRLGDWIPRLEAVDTPAGLALRGKGRCFLTLLPPREALESEDPLAGQLGYVPRTADVVRLSDVLSDSPSHPRQALRKALHRLAPTCRLLWCKTPWITKTVEQMKAGRDGAAASAHLWLEKTAFFKVPRCLQDETVEIHRRSFEELVEDLLPDVEDAPILGGHNRQPRPTTAGAPPEAGRPGALAGYQAHNTPQLWSDAGSRALPLQLGPSFMPDMSSSPFASYGSAANPRPRFGGGIGVDRGSSCETAASFGRFGQDSGTDGSAQEERMWANTGQGRRRLNARAALRAATHKNSAVVDSLSLERSRLHVLSLLNGQQRPSGEAYRQAAQVAPPTPQPRYSPSGDSDSNSLREGSEELSEPVKSVYECVAPLHIVVNAGGQLRPGPSAFVQCAPAAGAHLAGPRHAFATAPPQPQLPSHRGAFSRFARTDAICKIQPAMKAAADDIDYHPEPPIERRRFAAPVSMAAPPAQCLTFAKPPSAVASEPAGQPKKSWRKPRTARLQFWSHQSKELGKRRSREDDRDWRETPESDIFATRASGSGSDRTAAQPPGPKRRPRSGQDAGSDGSIGPDLCGAGPLEYLLHAVELVTE